MSNNIFNIEQELLDIYQQLEDNGGELTDELAERLDITESDFKYKVKSYVDVIKGINSDIQMIDEEITRLGNLKKSKKATKDRLNNIILTAVQNFGNTNKSGVKYVDWDTGKVSIRRASKVDVNEDAYKDVVSKLDRHIKCEVMNNDDFAMLNTIDEFANFVKTDTYEDGSSSKSENVTLDDLGDIRFNIVIPMDVKTYLTNKVETLKYIASNTVFHLEPTISKTDLKTAVLDNTKNLSIAKITPTESLIIK